PSASSIASDLEKRYHIDLGSAQNQGESFNVAANKQPTPEVSLFFNPSDPKDGQKLSAKAFPMYFSSKESNMYYTWYLKHAGCDLDNSPSGAKRSLCDRNGDGRVTVEDWKVEAAQIISQNGFDTKTADYGDGNDSDGYKARFGGDNRVSAADYCYVNDPATGKDYELAKGSATRFDCPSGTTAVCMVGDGQVDPDAIDIDPLLGTASGSTFTVSDSDTCKVSGIPACSSGTPICNVGTPRCVANPTTTTSCGSALAACSASTLAQANPYCRHLFPNAPGSTSGDGSYGGGEEKWWGTDPKDPDTADNGNKDEANITGLGEVTFTWNYVAGDQVGVAVEGMAMLPTKHDDSSLMIMWAFPKKDCPLSLAESTGAYFANIKGYSVQIPTADFDLNKCISRNLVDPTQGGQSTNLVLDVSATPDTPMNDESGDKTGDVVTALSNISNSSQNLSNTLYDWTVEISNTPQFRQDSYLVDITDDLQGMGLLGNAHGNALDSISVKLDIPRTTRFGNRTLASYVSNGSAYLRFTAKASENFSSGIVRKGKSDVVVKFSSSGKKIVAYKAGTTLINDKMRVTLPAGGPICDTDSLDRSLCRVMKNEIIGLKIDDTGLSNFSWTINGASFVCGNGNVSPLCRDGVQGNINFFPVSGNVGDTYTVSVTANNVTTSETETLTRSFHIVEPELSIVTIDDRAAWQKFLGQYRDITGKVSACPEGLCNEYSKSIFQGYSGAEMKFKADFLPGFLASSAERQWYVDGVPQAESAPGEISFVAGRSAGDVYSISLAARVVQPEETRRALLDIWGISQLDSPEINFSSS